MLLAEPTDEVDAELTLSPCYPTYESSVVISEIPMSAANGNSRPIRLFGTPAGSNSDSDLSLRGIAG